LGLTSIALALAGAVAAVAIRLQAGAWRVPGLGHDAGPWTIGLVLLVLGLGGAQLACLGIVGEYLGRVATQVKGRPLWIASQTVGLPRSEPPQSARR
jgi:hypothetical protein